MTARLRTLLRLHDLRDRPDADLLRLFADGRDEAAFELLVRRHGPLVLGVCRRALGDHAADDAFQATFLLLARRGPALREPAGLSRWLYGVAARVAREAQRQERRRRRREQRAARPESVHPPHDDPSTEVDAAVRRLPEPYRTAVLLCDLGGRSRAEAAAELGVPAGTVASRGGRGRQMLAADLTRRGLALGVLAAAVPAGRCESTARVAGLVAAGEAVVPAAVGALLTHGGRTMLGLKLAVATLVLGGGAAVVLPGGQKPAVPPAVAKPAETYAERLARLKTEYMKEAISATKQQTDPKSGEVVGVSMDPADEKRILGTYLPQLLELGDCPDEPTAVAALAYASNFTNRGFGLVPDADEAWKRLVERHGRSPRLAHFAREVANSRSPAINHRIELLLTWASDHTSRGLLEFHLAMSEDPALMHISGEVPANRDLRRELAAARYRRIIDQYADVDGGELARQAGRGLQRLTPETLRPGRPAPKTTGTDLAGQPIDLADFKGKVVVLEFWGSWCGPCVEATPGLKWVAETYADKGVVVLGVMAETDPAAARKSAEKLGVPWRNWLDVRTEGRSPIVAAWDVRRFPTTVVLDRAGVIRAVDPGQRAELAKAVDAALAGP